MESIIALIITFVLYLIYIPLIKGKIGQFEREEGLDSHKSKSGTPTMGGIIFILSITIIYIIYAIINKFQIDKVILLLLPFILMGIVGFLDDYLIIKKKNNIGLKPKEKMILLTIISILFYYLYQYFGYSTKFIIDLKIFYLILIFLMLVGTSNAVNLSDGLDGLCGGLSLIAISALTIIAHMNKAYEVEVLGLISIGGLLGFLLFNIHPAKIFMGDTGSLSLGGIMATMAIMLKVELLFIIIGFVFVIEALSVIIQVLYYKKFKKRIFKMAPIHHHFECMGYSEVNVVVLFWIIALLCAILSIIIYGGTM